jgi:thiol-disulfide isomerase/thioredoxin
MISPVRVLVPAIAVTGFLAGCSSSEPEPAPLSEATRAEVAKTRLDEMVKMAVTLGQSGQQAQAMSFLNDALRLDPKNREAIFRTAEYCLMLGRQGESRDPQGARNLYRRSGEAMRRLRESYPDLTPPERTIAALVRYAEARVLTHDEKPEEAVAALKDSLELGFDEPEMILTDPELDPLRDREDFRQVTAGLEVVADDKALKQAKAAVAEFKAFPFSFELPDLDGQTVKLDEVRGKVTIVDVWGTWCPPCRIELPHFVELYGKYHDRGLEIVGLTYEQTTTKEAAVEKVKEFLDKEIKLPYRLVLGDETTMTKMEPFEGFPTTLFLDAKGQVRAKLVGAQPKRTLESLVLALLDEPAEKPAAAASDGD